MIKLFICKLDELDKAIDIEKLYPFLDDVKLQRVKQKKRNQLESIVGHLLVSYILKHFYHLEDFALYYNDYQKPYIMNQGLYYNLSHSYDYIVCAVGSYEVGVDIEKIRKINSDKIAKTFFTKNEYEFVMNDLEKFFLVWTMKESYVKLLGKGLNELLKSFEVHLDKMEILHQDKKTYVKVYDVDKDYKLSVCCRNNYFSDKIEYVDSKKLFNRI